MGYRMTRSRILLGALIITLLGCTGSDNKEVIREAATSCLDIAQEAECIQSAFLTLKKHSESDPSSIRARLGFVEFGDLGLRQHPAAVNHVFNEIHALNSEDKPLLIVMFIHGWHHNAGADDTNVISFKQFLVDLQYEEDTASVSRTKRQVIGVYVGWRGESDNSWANPLTYGSRKSAGLRVGQYGLQEVLAELSKIRNSNGRNRLVAVGHSFGGGLLYSAVLQNLVDKVVSADNSPAGSEDERTLDEIGKAYGDLVILMNPALEAARVETLNRRLADTTFAACQPLVLASFTSEKDKALSFHFPKGQAVFFRDDLGVAEDVALVKTAYGRHEEYRTHELSCEGCTYRESSGQHYLTREQFVAAANQWDLFRTRADAPFSVDQMILNHFRLPKVRLSID